MQHSDKVSQTIVIMFTYSMFTCYFENFNTKYILYIYEDIYLERLDNSVQLRMRNYLLTVQRIKIPCFYITWKTFMRHFCIIV